MPGRIPKGFADWYLSGNYGTKMCVLDIFLLLAEKKTDVNKSSIRRRDQGALT
ncbi:protein of unknown function [Pseudodesulfovibrio piezophilus C1TLV30]|uniref:Uncharacterized protein n=1 Tax=Pseudodesulfovibrio piezophilus (strain DSM 21447 / JCM 15486 / C1TLV30) TaxID=1322246 RepID=M1WQJ9_PSEP2|nr:protein of unknown function [Pseudodesulfovibrio piezophilus C1TLV30]